MPFHNCKILSSPISSSHHQQRKQKQIRIAFVHSIEGEGVGGAAASTQRPLMAPRRSVDPFSAHGAGDSRPTAHGCENLPSGKRSWCTRASSSPAAPARRGRRAAVQSSCAACRAGAALGLGARREARSEAHGAH